MASLYLTTVVALLVTSTVLVSGVPVPKDEANMLGKLISLLEQNKNQEQAQMTDIEQKLSQMADIDQEDADNQIYKDQDNLLTQMIYEMLTNQEIEIESWDQQQSSDMKDTDKITQKTDQDIQQQAQHEEEMTDIQSISDKLLQLNKKEQAIAEALVEKIGQLQTIQTSLKSLETEAQEGKLGNVQYYGYGNRYADEGYGYRGYRGYGYRGYGGYGHGGYGYGRRRK